MPCCSAEASIGCQISFIFKYTARKFSETVRTVESDGRGVSFKVGKWPILELFAWSSCHRLDITNIGTTIVPVVQIQGRVEWAWWAWWAKLVFGANSCLGCWSEIFVLVLTGGSRHALWALVGATNVPRTIKSFVHAKGSLLLPVTSKPASPIYLLWPSQVYTFEACHAVLSEFWLVFVDMMGSFTLCSDLGVILTLHCQTSFCMYAMLVLVVRQSVSSFAGKHPPDCHMLQTSCLLIWSCWCFSEIATL